MGTINCRKNQKNEFLELKKLDQDQEETKARGQEEEVNHPYRWSIRCSEEESKKKNLKKNR